MEALEKLRKEIDDIDQHILELLAKRFSVVEKIGIVKKTYTIDITDPLREAEKLRVFQSVSEGYGISLDFIKKFWQLILEESKKLQEK